MDHYDYPVTLTPAEEGGFVVSFPDVPGANTEGDDRAEALMRAADALETILNVYLKDGKALPRPSRRRGPTVRPSSLGCLKLALHEAMREQAVSKTTLARRLGWHLPQVDRVLDLCHSSRIDQVETALRVLGLSVRVAMKRLPELFGASHGPPMAG